MIKCDLCKKEGNRSEQFYSSGDVKINNTEYKIFIDVKVEKLDLCPDCFCDIDAKLADLVVDFFESKKLMEK